MRLKRVKDPQLSDWTLTVKITHPGTFTFIMKDGKLIIKRDPPGHGASIAWFELEVPDA